jgi:hypothetical protein
MRRGAGASGAAATGALVVCAAGRPEAAATAGVELAAGGCTTTAAARCGGILRAFSAASFRSRISRAASPGFEIWEKSRDGGVSTRALVATLLPLRCPLK